MRTRPVALFVLASAGLLFSGYLSAVKLLSGSCAFNEPCPYFLGYPACWYGFAMYLVMFLVTAAALAWKEKVKRAVVADAVVSFIGILFAGNFVVQEIARSAFTGTLGFSTCVYGLVFYVAIFIVSFTALRKDSEANK